MTFPRERVQYWGTSSAYTSNTYTSVSGTSNTVTQTVSSAGTYYLTAKDTSGNVSSTVSKTFCKTTLNANGGSVSPASVLTMSGNSFTLPTPTRTGYTFKNWNTSSGGSGTAYTGSYKPTANVTLYAVWEKNETPIEPADVPMIAIRNYTQNKTVDYRTTLTFGVDPVQNPVSGAQVHWFIDGQDQSTGDSFTVSEAKNTYTVQAKYIKDGSVLAESQTEKVTVKAGFFARLKAFFRALFGRLPKEVQEAYDFNLLLNLLP